MKHKPGSTRFHQVHDQRGTSLIEMALLLPVVLLLLLGIIEIGRYAALSILVVNAAHAGAQYGAQNLVTAMDEAGMDTAAERDTQPAGGTGLLPGWNVTSSPCGCNMSGTSISTCSTCPATPGVYVQVNTSARFHSLFTYPGIPSSIRVNGQARMRVAE